MISGNTYEEIYEILNYMDLNSVMKIDKKIMDIIQKKRNSTFVTRIDKNDIFNEKNVSKETIDFLCWLDYKYWMEEDRKLKIDKIKFDIVQDEEEEKRKKYNPDDIFKDKASIQNNQPIQNNVALIEVKENFFTKFIKKLKNIFYIN